MAFRDIVRKATWTAIYLLFILAPLFALLAGAMPVAMPQVRVA